MNKLANNMRRFWNQTSPRNSHLGLSGEEEFLINRVHELILNKMSVKGKTIIDFGHGGGYTGKVVLEADCKQYIGYDISDRSNKRASENLEEFVNKELILLTEHRWDFSVKKPDIIIALAVMIHFPTQTYLNNFLSTVEASGAKRLVLEIRDPGVGMVMQKDPYNAGCFKPSPRTCLTCSTTKEYVAARLPSYDLVEFSDPKKAPTNCQILWFKKKKEKKADIPKDEKVTEDKPEEEKTEE